MNEFVAFTDRVDGMECLVAALHIEAHGIYDAFDSGYGSGNGVLIIDVGVDRINTKLNVRETRCRAFRMPRCNPYQKFALEQMLDDAAAEKTSPAKYGHLPSCHRSVPSPIPSCHSTASPQIGRQLSEDGWLLALPNDKPDLS
jgi:hypothetical protein